MCNYAKTLLSLRFSISYSHLFVIIISHNEKTMHLHAPFTVYVLANALSTFFFIKYQIVFLFIQYCSLFLFSCQEFDFLCLNPLFECSCLFANITSFFHSLYSLDFLFQFICISSFYLTLHFHFHLFCKCCFTGDSFITA